MPLGSTGKGSVVTEAAIVTLADARIKTLPTTSMQIVAAPGAGKVIVPLWVAVRCDTSNNGYTNIDPLASLAIEQSASESLLSVLGEQSGGSHKVSTLLAAFDDVFVLYVPSLAVGETTPFAEVYSRSAYDNKALSLVLHNQAAGNLTGGDAANVMTVATSYVIATIA